MLDCIPIHSVKLVVSSEEKNRKRKNKITKLSAMRINKKVIPRIIALLLRKRPEV